MSLRCPLLSYSYCLGISMLKNCQVLLLIGMKTSTSPRTLHNMVPSIAYFHFSIQRNFCFSRLLVIFLIPHTFAYYFHLTYYPTLNSSFSNSYFKLNSHLMKNILSALLDLFSTLFHPDLCPDGLRTTLTGTLDLQLSVKFGQRGALAEMG